MPTKKLPNLPRGLHRVANSPYIFFSWRDRRKVQHQKSTRTTDPVEALRFKIQFLEQQEKWPDDEVIRPNPVLPRLPLSEISEKYFAWKAVTNSDETILREKRLFKSVVRFFGANLRIWSINLAMIREYQQMRRKQRSRTTNKPVTTRTINYEIHLLRGVMQYAGCWSDELFHNYKPLRYIKHRAGKVASTEQLIQIIETGKTREEWLVATYCAAVAMGSGCRVGEIRKLQLKNISFAEGKLHITREVAKNTVEREPRLMELGQWGLRSLLDRARSLGATEPHHYLLPFQIEKSRFEAKTTKDDWDLSRPMVS